MTKGQVLVSGAQGRFGHHAAAAFAAAGWQVHRLVRPGKGAPGLVEGDAGDPDALTRAARGMDVIVHAVNPPYPAWGREIPRLTRAAIAAAKATGATVLIPGNVYVYGTGLPALLDEATPHAADTAKGRLRATMEAAFRDAGVPTIVLRAGDFIDTRPGANWFEGQIAVKAARGIVRYPGPTDRLHAWAFLPDMARAAEGLAAIRTTLPRFADIPFLGLALTGDDLIGHMQAALDRTLTRKPIPWGMMRLLSPFVPMLREVREMRYLWDRPHALDGARLATLLPGFRMTPAAQAIATALAGLGAPLQGIATSTQTSRWSDDTGRPVPVSRASGSSGAGQNTPAPVTTSRASGST